MDEVTREALEAARHELVTLHNLTVTDLPCDYENAVTWVTDTKAVVAKIDAALLAVSQETTPAEHSEAQD